MSDSAEHKYIRSLQENRPQDLLDILRDSTLAIGMVLSAMYIEPIIHSDLTKIFKAQFKLLLEFEGKDDKKNRDYYYNILLGSYMSGGDTKIKELQKLIYER